MNLDEIIQRLRTAFANEEIKRQVLDQYWFDLNIQRGIHSTGFCFASSEIIYRLDGGNNNWQVRKLRDPNDWNNGTHYFLKNRHTGVILDITANQYLDMNIEIPYNESVGASFRVISRKARTLARLAGIGEI